MGLEDIQKKIISDAEKKKQELLTVAEKNSTDIIKQGKLVANEYKQNNEKMFQSDGENIKRGLIIDARRKLANEILAKKRQHINQAFDLAKEEFISSKDYPIIMKSLVLKSIESKKESIILGKNETVLNVKWLEDVNKSCGGTLTFAQESGDFYGGLLLKEQDSFVNITVDMLFALLREDLEKPIADLLFKG